MEVHLTGRDPTAAVATETAIKQVDGGLAQLLTVEELRGLRARRRSATQRLTER